MLSQLPLAALRHTSPRLPQGKCWHYFWKLNLSKLPRRPFDKAIRRIPWHDLGYLATLLEAFGHPGDMTVAELMQRVDGYLNRTEATQHERFRELADRVDRMSISQLETLSARLDDLQAEMGAA